MPEFLVISSRLRFALGRMMWAAGAILLVAQRSSGADESWPQFLGPDRNGVYAGPPLAARWPEEGPRVVWRREVGAGFSGPVVSGERLILFHRRGGDEVIECIDRTSGRTLWKTNYATRYRDDFGFDDGPRATPTLASGWVYTLGAEGKLCGMDLGSGAVRWSVDTQKEFGARKGFFGLACSPWVEGDLVIVQVGGENGAGIVAFERTTGRVRWKATEDEAGYSSPVGATVAGKRLIWCFTREGLIAMAPMDGTVWHRFPWRARMHASVNAAVPLVVGDEVFVSASYGTGAALLRVNAGGLETVWSGDTALSVHYATPVYRAGYLYGVHGRADPGFSPSPSLRCVEWKTGRVRWTKEGLGAGTVMLAGDRLLFLSDRGELIVAAAEPDGYREMGRSHILGGEVRAHPALAAGRLYARNRTHLISVDLQSDLKP
ncbi:MAG TPA: PQQ-binding-like beta-propeller repeat protein [Methylomirabilota bacterium]|nr:PQQ-binding-like beta-propeller repeat protein [Methylomirabilota bacterium]